MTHIDNILLDDGRGHFATHERDGDAHTLRRDPLGVNKLFFGLDEGRVESATYLDDLRKGGWAPSQIWSVPSGHRVEIDLGARTLSVVKEAGPEFVVDDDDSIEAHAARIRACLDDAFTSLADVLEGELFVTLSGGLDSTGIAVLAKEHLGDFTAVSFTVEGEDREGGDLAAARRVADALGVRLLEVHMPREALAARVDDVIRWGQDWRDFNVHCGLVNLALAEALPRGATVLTGDGMNELMADYSPVEVEGRVLYELPRLSPGKLRRYLVQGLDSGDREVGIFARRGVRTVQPYLLCADAYAALPERFVAHEGSKQELVRHVLGASVPAFVYDRPKVRAQVGSSQEVGGTVRVTLEAGLDQAALSARFRELFGFSERDQRKLIRAGYYRFPTAWPQA